MKRHTWNDTGELATPLIRCCCLVLSRRSETCQVLCVSGGVEVVVFSSCHLRYGWHACPRCAATVVRPCLCFQARRFPFPGIYKTTHVTRCPCRTMKWNTFQGLGWNETECHAMQCNAMACLIARPISPSHLAPVLLVINWLQSCRINVMRLFFFFFLCHQSNGTKRNGAQRIFRPGESLGKQ